MTGARTGIGRFLCEFLLERGFLVVGCSRRPAEWSADGFTHLEADVTREAEVRAVLEHVRRAHGSLYALINSAGAASMNHFLLTPASTVEKLLATNVEGTFLVSREAAKLMRGAGAGRIVNISSIAVPLRLAGQAAYVASKAAVERLSQVMAAELAEYGITVNVVGATPIDTDMTRGVPRRKMEQLIAALPLSRMGTLEDVANVVEFFLRPESTAVSGQVIYLGGVPTS